MGLSLSIFVFVHPLDRVSELAVVARSLCWPEVSLLIEIHFKVSSETIFLRRRLRAAR